MTSKTHQSLSIMLGQILYPRFLQMIYENKFYWTLGFIGGIIWGTLIPDMDAPHSEFSKRLISQRNIIYISSIFLALLLGLRFQSPYVFIAMFFAIYFLLNFIFKKYFVHRGIAHSIWGLLFLNIILLLPQNFVMFLPTYFLSLYNGLIIGLNLGFLSHLIGDSLTFSGIRPFFPLNFKITFHLFRTNSSTEKIIFYFSLTMNLVLLINLIIGGKST